MRKFLITIGAEVLVIGVPYAISPEWLSTNIPYVIAAGLFVLALGISWPPKMGKAEITLIDSDPTLPKTVEEHSRVDFSECLKITKGWMAAGTNREGKINLCINWKLYSKFLVVYVPHAEKTLNIIRELSFEIQDKIDEMQKSVRVFSKAPGDLSDVEMASIPFVNRVVVYHESRLSLHDAALLMELYQEKGLTLVLRGSDYAYQQWLIARVGDKNSASVASA